MLPLKCPQLPQPNIFLRASVRLRAGVSGGIFLIIYALPSFAQSVNSPNTPLLCSIPNLSILISSMYGFITSLFGLIAISKILRSIFDE